jgi:transposase-like protein
MEHAPTSPDAPLTPTDPHFPPAQRIRDIGFVPPRCPHARCPAHAAPKKPGSHAFRRRGYFKRRVDGLVVQRFACETCGRSFSSQTFRLDYRLRRLDTMLPVFTALHSKTTLRKTARNLGLGRAHVARRIRRLAVHGRDYHALRLERIAAGGGLGANFQFDELETYESHRKLKPLTACVLIERQSGFIASIEVGTLAARGRRTPKEEETRAKYQELEGPRRSESWKIVQKTAATISRIAKKGDHVLVTTDLKASYAKALQKSLGKRLVHERVSGRAERGSKSQLFPINHTLARLRDLVSRLVRQTWAASKKRSWLVQHLAVLIGFRNYVDGWRSEPAARQKTSAGEVLGATTRKLTAPEYLVWGDPLCAPA